MLQVIFVLAAVVTGSVQAIVNGTVVNPMDWRSVVLLQLVDPDNGLNTSCTAVIISERYAITTASCVMHEETGKQVSKVKVCIGHKKPFNGANQQCFISNQIYSHHNFINDSGISAASNLAYIKLGSNINLTNLKISPATLITPDEFSNLVRKPNLPDITWVGFDSDNLNPLENYRGSGLGVKRQGQVANAEFDYQSRAILVNSLEIRPGKKYQGIASFIQNDAGDWRLLGLVSQSTPDKIVDFDPEYNPCDEDPIHVPHPKPILQAKTVITAYPVAACGMVGFVKSNGFGELACKKLLLRNLDWSKAIKREEPIALRQKALSLYQNNQSTDDAGDIYKLLYLAYKSGDVTAQISLSRFLMEGKIFTQDIEQSRQILDELANNNQPHASLLLAKMMLLQNQSSQFAPSSETRDKKIVQLLQHPANSGFAEAQYLLAGLYQRGIGVKKNQSKAFHWYAIAAMQGHADSQYQLGMHWNDGRGVRSYQEAALFWIHQAAAQGQLDAQNHLGMLKPVAAD